VEVLAAISTSSLGAIRHNVKGIVKYIYRTAYPFNCAKEKNALHCRCDPQCPVYHLPDAPLPRQGVDPEPVLARKRRGDEPKGVVIPVKERYREQFEKSVAVIREMRAAGQKVSEILKRLNAESLPTKTGRQWRVHSLHETLRTLQ
jgi:hypothetical protein